MKTVLIATLLFTLFGCDSKDSNFGKVEINDKTINRFAQTEKTFECKEKIEDFDSGYAKLILNGNKLEIINNYNDGDEAVKIQFVINKDLSIENINYSFSDDVEDESKNKYQVIAAKLNLNKNPFKENINGISGNYYLKINCINSPQEFWKFSKESQKSFKGIIKCK